MSLYPFSTLMMVRKRQRENLLLQLKDAKEKVLDAKNSLIKLEKNLNLAQEQRRTLQDNFFFQPRNLTTAFIRQSHISKEKQILNKENSLKQEIRFQKKLYLEAKDNFKKVEEKATKSHRELKVLDKHFILWQKSVHKKLAHKENENNDDVNTTRFILNKKKG